jgi:melibiose permease/lactose/raffinose/galactose permease
VENTGVREMVKIIFKNDQLLWVTLGMLLFMTGYTTTASLGIYYFKYIYGNENMYSLFALVLGVSQISALIAFPYIRRKMTRNSMYLLATVMVCLGYALFFFSNDQSMIPIVVSGISLFAGQAMIQLLMLMFITDTVEYGEWKFNKRNDSVTFSLQPFIYKMAGALASGLVGVTLILSGIKTDATFVALTSSGRLIFKMAMLVLPLLLILIGYLVLRRKYRLDETTYQTILNELKIRRGENST